MVLSCCLVLYCATFYRFLCFIIYNFLWYVLWIIINFIRTFCWRCNYGRSYSRLILAVVLSCCLVLYCATFYRFLCFIIHNFLRYVLWIIINFIRTFSWRYNYGRSYSRLILAVVLTCCLVLNCATFYRFLCFIIHNFLRYVLWIIINFIRTFCWLCNYGRSYSRLILAVVLSCCLVLYCATFYRFL